jgi:transmembrane protein EpsG
MLAVIPIFYVAWSYKDKAAPYITVLVYNLFFYTETYNTIRQDIAMSMVMLAVRMFEVKNYKLYIFFQIIAVMFHRSSLIGLILPVLFLIIKRNRKNTYFVYLVVFLSLNIFTVLYVPIFTFLVDKLGFLPGRYLNNNYLYSKEKDIPFVNILVCTIAFIILFIKRNNNTKKTWYDWLNSINVIVLGLVPFATVANFVERIGLYFLIYIILAYGVGITLVKKSDENRLVYYGGVTVLFLLLWLYMYVGLGVNSILPYEIG